MGSARCDVVIVGAGPAGAATATALVRRGLSVTVLERRREPASRIGETVPEDIRPPLERLGAWPDFCAQGHLPSSGTASAWGTADLLLSRGGGWHLDRGRFDALLMHIAQRAGAELRMGASVRAIGGDGDDWIVRAVDGQQRPVDVRAGFLVDATGRAAAVAQRLGAARLRHDRFVCAHAQVEPGGEAIGARSLVETVSDGWWYATPLPGGRALAGVFTDPVVCRRRGYGTPERWHEALRSTLYVYRALGSPPRPRRVRLAASTPHCLDRPAGVDWLAVGDAAASYDPLASAGLTLAVRAGEEAATAIVARRDGDRHALAHHARAVQERFTTYLLQRRELYARERRWPRSPFWASRRGGR
jgi:flavin-dependent dehydrogenase